MAGVRHDRGQLLLVGALAIAVLVLGLGAVLNTAVVTEQIAASSGTAASGSAPLQYRHAVHRGVGGTLRGVNHPDVPSRQSLERLDGSLPTTLTDVSHATLRQRLASEVGNWSGLTTRLDAMEMRATRVSLVGTTNGSRIAQYERRNFTNQSGATNWTVADDVTGARGFRLNVSTDSLSDCDDDPCFRIVVENASSTWRITFGEHSGNLRVTMTGPNGTQTCDATGEYVLVDLSTATVDGDSCSALGALSNVEPPFDVRYRNADQVVGRYGLVVDAQVAEEPHYDGSGGPEVSPAVYAADVRLVFRTERVTYQTTIRVAPGETNA